MYVLGFIFHESFYLVKDSNDKILKFANPEKASEFKNSCSLYELNNEGTKMVRVDHMGFRSDLPISKRLTLPEQLCL